MTDRNDLAHEGTEAAHRPPVITAAWIVFFGLVLLGVMIWQPWATPKWADVETSDGRQTNSMCTVYKFSVDCR
ncbi:hypothetical protein AXK59_07420 [Tsukamurella tyrosinosolvens]|nr:hypothetical protein AXK59_07420 [Tsukamurella tyrosinosolvens]